MRYKNDQRSHFSWATGTNSKIVKEYEERYNRISQILDDNPEILDIVHRDLWKSLLKIFEFVLILVTRNQIINALMISRPKVIFRAGFKQ